MGLAYFNQLDDAIFQTSGPGTAGLQVVCDKLAERDDCPSSSRLISSGKRCKTLCQASLDELGSPPTKANDRGDMFWYTREGFLHRSCDKPAVIEADGTQEWWSAKKNAEKPAIVYADGTKGWWINGRRVR